MKTSVIITTYNRPDALEMVLKGYDNQSFKDFEIIIADDGSDDSTKKLIEKYQTILSIPIHHVWHTDMGFRAAKIRNLAVEHTNSEYLIFTDGDCIPSKNFVKTHINLAEPGWFLSGSRILLSPQLTQKITQEQLPIHKWNNKKLLNEFLNKNINTLRPILLQLPKLNFLRKIQARDWKQARTCNLSLFRKDFIKINGFNEQFIGWGKEDSDLILRLIQSDIFFKSLRFTSPVFHLWHKENDRSNINKNNELFEITLNKNR